jgi:hypothetical protein
MVFATLDDEEEKEVLRLSRFYWQEAKRCEKAKAYLAGCVMLGSALETFLMLMVNLFEDEASQTGKIPMRRGQPKPLLEWNLAELLGVAKAANWLPAALDPNDGWNGRRARTGDYAEVVRQLRNLAHPARYREDLFGKRFTGKYLRMQFRFMLLCRNWLADRNNRSPLGRAR